MKILFKNNTRYTKERYNEFIEFHRNKYGKKIILKMIAICIWLSYILIFNIIIKNWILIFSAILVTMLLYLINNKKQSKRENRKQKILNNQKEFSFYFYDEYIKIKYGRKFERLKYFHLYKIFETEKNFFLYTDETHSLILSKDGFEIGNTADFSSFIKKKCPLKYKNEKKRG